MRNQFGKPLRQHLVPGGDEVKALFATVFPLRLMAKDVRTADEAYALGIATPLADLCAQLWDAAAQTLDEKANHTEVLRYMERLGG